MSVLIASTSYGWSAAQAAFVPSRWRAELSQPLPRTNRRSNLRLPERLGVTSINKNSSTPRGMTIDIAPAVADLKTSTPIDVQGPGGGKDHSRRRFSAEARIRRVGPGLPADFDPCNFGQVGVIVRLKFGQARWRIWFPIPNDRPIAYAR